MKRIFTKCISLSFLLLFILSTQVNAQELVEIDVSNNVFTPNSVTISQGDTVRWTNTQGNHNVNGTASDYPNNPEAFGNDVGSGWTYEFVFNVVGFYEYHCDPHVSLGMTGDITVEEPTNIFELETAIELVENVFPMPAKDFVYLELNTDLISHNTNLNIQVYDTKGAIVKHIQTTPADRIKISTSDLSSGTYIFNILDANNVLDTGKLIKL